MTIRELIDKKKRNASALLQERATHRATITAVREACERENRDPNPAEVGRVNSATANIRRLDATPELMEIADLEREFREDEAAEATAREVHPGADSPSGSAPARNLTHDGRTASARRSAGDWVRTHDGRSAVVERGASWAGNDVVRSASSRQSARDSAMVNQHGSLGEMVRAMSTTGGAAVVPETWFGEIIDRARNLSAVMQAGAQLVPMDAKTIHIGRLTGDPTVAFRQENSLIAASDPTFDNVTLTAKTASLLTVGSMEWFDDAEDGVDEVVNNAIAQAFATHIDLVSLYGGIVTGSGDLNLPTPPNPRGLLAALAATASDSVLGDGVNGTAQTSGKVYDELLDTLFKPQQFNETPNAMIWNPKAALQYAKQYDTTGQPLAAPKDIADLPKYVTNQVPSYTRGTMTNRATDVFLGDWSKLLIGQRLGLNVQVLTERYAENGQIGIVAHWRGDVGVARPRAFAAYRAIQGAA